MDAARAEVVRTERDASSHTALVVLDRPEARNALSRGVVEGLRVAAASLARDPAIHTVFLTGVGEKAFCAGADLRERQDWTLDQTRAFVATLNDTFDAWAALPQLTVCALNGSAYGGGLELALACDLRLAVAGVEMGLTEARWGIIPGAGGTQRLPRLIGAGRAKELILGGKTILTELALEWGLVNAVMRRGAETSLAALRAALAGVIGDTPRAPLSIRAAKQAIDGGIGLPLAEGLSLERRCYETTLVSGDRNEGLRAFAEKRRPVYKGE